MRDPTPQERRERKEKRYREALEANAEIQAFVKGYRAGIGDNPADAKWLDFITEKAATMMNAVFIVGEELEDEDD